jgi:hypothetical protein
MIYSLVSTGSNGIHRESHHRGSIYCQLSVLIYENNAQFLTTSKNLYQETESHTLH